MRKITCGKKILLRLCLSISALLALSLAVRRLLGLSGGHWLSPAGAAAFVPLALLAVLAVRSFRGDVGFLRRLGALMDGDNADATYSQEEHGTLLGLSETALLDQLGRRLRESSVSRALKTEAELHALQNQINPHFLYNTLEIIRSRAMVQGNADVAEMVEALAMLFRYCINSPGEFATLAQELDNVRDYLLIQRYRYGDRFVYREEFRDESDAVMNSSLPVMTLQPLIENALVHGINPKVEGGAITLRVETIGHRLRIIIEDDGVGIPDAQLRSLRHSLQEEDAPRCGERGGAHIGIAMKNVNKRIQFYFGAEYGVDITSTQGVGTTVTLTLPWLGGAGEEGET